MIAEPIARVGLRNGSGRVRALTFCPECARGV